MVNTIPVKMLNDNEIIMVDDDSGEIMICERLIKSLKIPNPFISFRTGEGFLEYMSQVRQGLKRMPAIVLLDIRMPMMDGFDVLTRIRQESRFSQIPVITMFSNSDAPSDIERSLKLGANGYQTKPADIQSFKDFLLSLLPSDGSGSKLTSTP